MEFEESSLYIVFQECLCKRDSNGFLLLSFVHDTFIALLISISYTTTTVLLSYYEDDVEIYVLLNYLNLNLM